jgi:glycosyltransferase involved in cell wall biosynthesis
LISPRISIITPSFNQGRFIERTIRSVLTQDVSGLEYVVIDGGSTDETIYILRRYEDRLRWISEKDNGQTDAINKGIKATRGAIIGWLNSDDIYYPEALSSVVSFFEKYPEVEAVYGDGNHIDENDTIIESYYTEDWDYQRLKEICFLCQPAVFFRRRLTEKAGLLDDRLQYCMDYEYWLRLGATVPFVRIPQTLAGSRMYKSNKTMRARIAVHHEINEMVRKKFGMVPERWIYAYAHAVVDEKGYDRQNSWENVKYMLQLIRATIGSFVHWDQGFSISTAKNLVVWAVGVSLYILRRWLHEPGINREDRF